MKRSFSNIVSLRGAYHFPILAALAIITFDVASPSKAETLLTYTVDGTYNNGGGTVTGTFTTDATIAALASGDRGTITSINLVETSSGGINFGNTFNFTDPNPLFVSLTTEDGPGSIEQLFDNDGGNQLNLGFDLDGGALATTGFGHSFVLTEFSGAPGFVVSGTITEGAGIAAGVPEPASWALMLVGFGGLGAAMRTCRRANTAVA
jgi:hypothetical protein